jgi:short-chain fatty acids transporter
MKRVIGFFTRLCEAYLPDAFIFCLILTLIVFGFSLVLTSHSAVELVGFWGKDFWALNGFAMQMVFVLISGHMLASTALVKSILGMIISPVKNETQGILVLSFFSLIFCWLNWGFGLIVSGIMAIKLAQKLGKVSFGLFIATAYAGFVVWHGGLSGSIPLKIAGGDEILARTFPDLKIPLSETIFASWNLLIVGILLLTFPLLAVLMKTDEKTEVKIEEQKDEELVVIQSLADKLENFKGFNLIFFLFFLIILVKGWFAGESLDINRVNMIFLFLAFLLHGTPKKFMKSLHHSFGFASSIVIQFPFYAGLMGLMQYSGLADIISQVFVSISTSQTLPLWSFLSGGIVNFFVPSGGGQWVVQGPIMLKAAKELAVDPAKISMALAWGDAWTNLVQPFWALPLLGMAGLKLKDIMGYCLIYLAWSALVISSVLFWI